MRVQLVRGLQQRALAVRPFGRARSDRDALELGVGQSGELTDAVVLVDFVRTLAQVTGAQDLMNAIADSAAAKRCYAQRWVTFAYERTINSADSCTVDNLATSLTQSGYTVLNLVADLTQADSFRLRVQEQ